MRSARQQGGVAGGGDNGRADAASCFLGPELQAESRADVAWECAAVDSGVIGRSMGGGRQQGEVVRGGGAGGTGVASFFRGQRSEADLGPMWVCQRLKPGICAALWAPVSWIPTLANLWDRRKVDGSKARWWAEALKGLAQLAAFRGQSSR